MDQQVTIETFRGFLDNRSEVKVHILVQWCPLHLNAIMSEMKHQSGNDPLGQVLVSKLPRNHSLWTTESIMRPKYRACQLAIGRSHTVLGPGLPARISAVRRLRDHAHGTETDALLAAARARGKARGKGSIRLSQLFPSTALHPKLTSPSLRSPPRMRLLSSSRSLQDWSGNTPSEMRLSLTIASS